ncbi:hypothetical protein NE237_024991 [Protea cynaroides]|uniref:Uncharacterized protein n=1 Tax=Protea cynaroides TaxID=273540 RepID=A0A9Q0H4D1_9MAGN|nr:hypothetical protein NE237_024991 [Protea cynaroides]
MEMICKCVRIEDSHRNPRLVENPRNIESSETAIVQSLPLSAIPSDSFLISSFPALFFPYYPWRILAIEAYLSYFICFLFYPRPPGLNFLIMVVYLSLNVKTSSEGLPETFSNLSVGVARKRLIQKERETLKIERQRREREPRRIETVSDLFGFFFFSLKFTENYYILWFNISFYSRISVKIKEEREQRKAKETSPQITKPPLHPASFSWLW